jgi:hypothetical protein
MKPSSNSYKKLRSEIPRLPVKIVEFKLTMKGDTQ